MIRSTQIASGAHWCNLIVYLGDFVRALLVSAAQYISSGVLPTLP